MNRHLVRRSVHLASILVAVGSLASAALARTPPPPPNGGFVIPPDLDVPASLRPWIGWVMHDQRDHLCPPLDGEKSDTVCEWPARLSLAVDDKGGRFTQTWSIRGRRARVGLPGDGKRWPEDVRVDGRPAVVIPLEGHPSVILPPGDHLVTGAFLWDERPESIAVPKETGLIALTVSGRKVELPSRDADGSLWLQKEASKQEADVLEIAVHRLVDDGIPLQLVTRIQLRVSGHSREVVLGRALGEGFIPMSLDSPLPARVEPDSRLRVQVRPGTFQITLTARHDGPVSSLARPAPDGPWKEGDEVWAFRAHPDLRVVTVEGVNSIDPQQTLLPDEWKRLPTYPVKQGDTVTLVEHQRGDADPAPDSLSLSRILWLDFDGGGFTASDHISGTLHRAWRLEMNPPTQLGRVAVGGIDQFITAAEPDEPSDKSKAQGGGRAGVEIRQGSVELYAESRLAGGGTLPAVSWDADFHDVSGTLHLPPGWRLLSASGADEVGNTWIGRWSLLDFFLGLIIAMAVARLYGLRWGALALFALTLALPEGEAPRFSWLYVLAAEALVRLLPAGKLSTAVRVVRLGARILLVLFVVTFAAQHLRSGLYPALAGGEAGVDGEQAEPTPEWLQRTVDGKAGGRGRAAADGAPGAPAEQAAAGSVDEPSGGSGGVYAKVRKGAAKSDNNNNWTNEYDPNAMVQTGPGRPRWSWSTVPLRWTGPVERTQTLRLLLLPPWLNLVLALVRVLLLSALVLRLFDSSRPLGSGLLRAQQAMRFALFAFVGLALFAGPARADDPAPANGANGTNVTPNAPANAILDELRTRLLQPAECRPNCASSPRLLLEATPNLLRLRMEIDAAAPVGVPLPGTAGQWEPETVLLDGKPASALVRDNGKLWIAVGEGSHQVVLEGALPARDTVQIALPGKSHRVTAKTDGWRLDGLHEDGVADDDLQLTRVRDRGGVASALQPGSLPPLVRVERQITLGLVWQVETKVVRVTPTGSAVVLEVPLLFGESVTTDDVRVAAGKALVNIAPGETEVSWRSQLKEVSALALSAPRTSQWIEVWRLEVSPIWHVAIAGIPVVGQGGEANLRRPEWHPWPGESVTLSVSRPKGIAGQTLTIDHSALSVSPGLRATDTTLAIDLRASRGGQHTIVLPESAAIQSLIVDGRAQPIRQDKGRLTLPLVPGSQHVIVAWRQPDPIATRFRSPSVDLGAPSVNADLCIELANDRWVLLAGGPRLGPAVLFWSLILLLAMVSAALGKVRWTPLRFHHWLLLGLGLSQVPLALAMVVAGWLLLIGWRHERPGQAWESLAFNGRQLLLVAATAAAACILFIAIREGLLGRPDMQVSGNGSDAEHLRWFQDRTTGSLPRAWALSVPLWVYRVAMLLWALWLARALLEWMRWGWTSFGLGGLWRKKPPKAPPAVAPGSAPAPASPPAPANPQRTS